MTLSRFLGFFGVLLLPLVSAPACESHKCLTRTCHSVLQIYVRHPDGVVPPGAFELEIEADGVSYTCRNQVPGDLDKAVRCIAEGGAPVDAGGADAGAEPGFLLILGEDVACNSFETGSGLNDACTSPGTSAQQIRLDVPDGAKLPETLRLHARFADGLDATEDIEPNYLDISINGTGCPGVCQTATTSWTLQN